MLKLDIWLKKKQTNMDTVECGGRISNGISYYFWLVKHDWMKQFFNILHYGKLNWMFVSLTFLSFNCLTYIFLNLMWSSNWSDKKILLCFYGDKIILFIKWHLITFDSFIIGSKGDELLESIYMGVHRGIRKGVQKKR